MKKILFAIAIFAVIVPTAFFMTACFGGGGGNDNNGGGGGNGGGGNGGGNGPGNGGPNLPLTLAEKVSGTWGFDGIRIHGQMFTSADFIVSGGTATALHANAMPRVNIIVAEIYADPDRWEDYVIWSKQGVIWDELVEPFKQMLVFNNGVTVANAQTIRNATTSIVNTAATHSGFAPQKTQALQDAFSGTIDSLIGVAFDFGDEDWFDGHWGIFDTILDIFVESATKQDFATFFAGMLVEEFNWSASADIVLSVTNGEPNFLDYFLESESIVVVQNLPNPWHDPSDPESNPTRGMSLFWCVDTDTLIENHEGDWGTIFTRRN